MGATVRLEFPSEESGCSWAHVWLRCSPCSMVDTFYIKGAKCGGGFKEAGSEVGQAFLVKQPNHRRQCLKLYQVSGQSRDGKI